MFDLTAERNVDPTYLRHFQRAERWSGSSGRPDELQGFGHQQRKLRACARVTCSARRQDWSRCCARQKPGSGRNSTTSPFTHDCATARAESCLDLETRYWLRGAEGQGTSPCSTSSWIALRARMAQYFLERRATSWEVTVWWRWKASRCGKLHKNLRAPCALVIIGRCGQAEHWDFRADEGTLAAKHMNLHKGSHLQRRQSDGPIHQLGQCKTPAQP